MPREKASFSKCKKIKIYSTSYHSPKIKAYYQQYYKQKANKLMKMEQLFTERKWIKKLRKKSKTI